MDEMQSLSRNNCNDRVNGEKVKKKKKKSKTTDHHELTESPQEQTEKRRKKKHKRKNGQTESDNDLQTHTGKKKRRKLDDEGETSVMDDVVSNQHEAQTQELQGSSEEKTSKRKKKKKKLKQTNCEDMAKEQTDMSTDDEDEEEPNTRDEESEKSKRKQIPETLFDAALLEEVQELCPTFRLDYRSKSYFTNIIRYDLPRLREFRKQGIQLRQGRFSVAENERLRQNVNDFLTLTGVKNAVRLFFPSRFPREVKALKKVKRKHGFFLKIAEGIPRLCSVVYDRGSKIFDDRNYKGTFTEEEEKMLIKYYKQYGRNWKKISEKTNRSCGALCLRVSIIDKRKGPWTTKEVQRLLRAVRDHVVSVLKSENPKKKPKRVSREILYKNLPWVKISRQVKTRCWFTCRYKWVSNLAARMSSVTSFRGRKFQKARIKLIKAMYELQVEDFVDVQWEDLTAIFGDVPPAHVQLKWHHLKVSYVPDWKNKSFGDTVDFLYENVLPGLVKEYKDLDDDDDDDELKVDQKQSFLLADIFKDINEDECCESDEETGQQEKHSST